MMFGLPFSSYFGAAEEMLEYFDVFDNGDGFSAYIFMKARVGYGDSYWGIVVDEKLVKVVYLREGEPEPFEIHYNSFKSVHQFSAVPSGQVNDLLEFAVVWQQLDFVSDKGKALTVSWDAVVEVMEAYGDNGQLSSWSLTGTERFNTGKQVPDFRTRMKLDVVLTDSGGTRTVSIRAGKVILASGSLSGDGTLTLTEQNDSGISGTVDVTYTADLLLSNSWLIVRWAKQYEVHVGQSLSFPRTPELVVNDPGLSNRLSTTVQNLTAGSNEVVVVAVTDTNITGTNTAVQDTVSVPGRPEPPGDISLATSQPATPDSSGTVIEFAASSTGGATYLIYDSVLGFPTNFTVVADTHIAGSGTISHTLPSMSPNAGVRHVVVESLNGGIESGFRKSIAIEYDATGNIVRPRPNIPGFSLKSISGRTLTIQYTYDRRGEEGSATSVELFVVAEGGSVNWSSASDSDSLSATDTIITGEMSFTAAGDGPFLFAVRAKTDDSVHSENTSLHGPRWVSSAVPATPGNVSAVVSG